MLPCTAGARPGKMNMMSRPNSAISRLLPERNPSPTPTRSSSEPTPHAIPNIVRKDRSLWAHKLRQICAKMSTTARIYVGNIVMCDAAFRRKEEGITANFRYSDAHQLDQL